MDTIIIENLLYTGIHGVYAQEHTTPQRFSLTIKLDVDTRAAGTSDDLADTIDYGTVQQKARDIIEGKHADLIEHLGHRILDSILEERRIYEAEVHIKKIDIWDNGIPSVIIRKKQREHILRISNTAQETLARTLQNSDVCVLTLLTKDTCTALTDEVAKLSFTKAEHVYGTHLVEQHFSYSYDYKEDGLVHKLQNELEDFLSTITIQNTSIFETPLSFNEIATQEYEPSLIGITTHKDESIFKNIIVVCNITGSATFYTTTSRDNGKETSYLVEPGDVIFMKAPGFLGGNSRPLHGVREILSRRTSITFRQKIT